MHSLVPSGNPYAQCRGLIVSFHAFRHHVYSQITRNLKHATDDRSAWVRGR